VQAEKIIINRFPSFLKGGGEMVKLIRSYNWSDTSLGNLESWPQSLRTTLGIILNSKFPMFLFWGEEHICFYNDAYRPSMGVNGKHPYSLGKKAIEVWPEIWKDICPLIEGIMNGGESTLNEDHLLPIYRNGKMEDVYWTFSYSPVYDEHERPAGVFVTCTETTEKFSALKNKYELNLALEIAELGTYKLTLATNIVTISERIMNWFGFTSQEIPLNKLKSIVHPNDLYRTAKFLNDTTKSEALSRHDMQYTVIDPITGQERHIRSIGKAVFENNIPISIEGILQDITEQANIQKKIEQSEQRFRNLIRYATVGVVVLTGPEMVVDIANEFYCQVVGKHYKELIGRPLFEVIPEMGDYFRKEIERVRITGIPKYLYEQAFFTLQDGEKKEGYINLVYQPVKEKNDEISGVLVLVHDVTEQVTARQVVEFAEQRARLAIDTAGLGLYEVNLVTDEIIPDANFIKLYGFDFPAKRSDYLATVHPEDRHIRNDAHDLSVVTGHLQYECRLVWQDGSIHWVHVAGKVFYDNNQAAVWLLGAVQDITQQKFAEEELEKKVAARTKALAEVNQQLNKTNTELNQFAYIASHDLQEPLRKITTYTGMLQTSLGEMAENSRNYIDKIINSSNRMKSLIRDVLAFSQVSESGQAFQVTDLNHVLEDIREDYEILIARKAAVIDSNRLPVIEAFPLQMNQLFANLLSNALKFNKSDTSPHINIEARIATPGDMANAPGLNPQLDYYCIRFKDNGIGFNPEYAEKIFAIFQRLHNKQLFDGTGIGLAICRKIALNHNGYISASSEPNHGATFIIILPSKQPTDSR
jgi:PAS domain S-box-containing protein